MAKTSRTRRLEEVTSVAWLPNQLMEIISFRVIVMWGRWERDETCSIRKHTEWEESFATVSLLGDFAACETFQEGFRP
jgi:hypothetical protein